MQKHQHQAKFSIKSKPITVARTSQIQQKEQFNYCSKRKLIQKQQAKYSRKNKPNAAERTSQMQQKEQANYNSKNKPISAARASQLQYMPINANISSEIK